jgi:hypothetical protein
MTPSTGVHPMLLALLRGESGESLARLAPAPDEWSALLEAAEHHALTPLLHRALVSTGAADTLPPPARDALAERAAGVAARNLLFADELNEILTLAAQRSLCVAPLRGLALGERLHGDASLRPMGDLDLLVRKHELDAMTVLLRERGYEEIDRRPGFARAFSYTLEFAKHRHGWMIVEPHWTIAYPPFGERVAMDRVWRRCQRGAVAGVETWRLASADLLLHLCLHATHKGAHAPLLWLYEIDRLVRRESAALDWLTFVAEAEAAAMTTLIAPVINIVCNLLYTPVPPGVRDTLGRPPAQARDRWLARLAAPESRADGRESLAALFALPTFGQRARYVGSLLFPSRRFMAIEYGSVGRGALLAAYARRVRFISSHAVKGLARLFF